MDVLEASAPRKEWDERKGMSSRSNNKHIFTKRNQFSLNLADQGTISLNFVNLRIFSFVNVCVRKLYEIRKCVSLTLALANLRTYEFVNTLYCEGKIFVLYLREMT